MREGERKGGREGGRTVGWDSRTHMHLYRDRWIYPMEYPMVPCSFGMGRDSGTYAYVREIGGHPMECPMVPKDCGMG